MAMANNTHAIAACLAAHTPYALVAIPGTELIDACRACGTAGHEIQDCPAIRAGMEDASGVQRDLTPLIDTHGTVEELREQLAAVQDQIIQRDIWLTDASFVEQDLRLALDEAHQHIGALVARGAQMEADLIAIADHEIQTTGDDPVQAIRDLLAAISTLQDIAANSTAGIAHDHHCAEGYGPATERNNAIDAARAWLRRAQE